MIYRSNGPERIHGRKAQRRRSKSQGYAFDAEAVATAETPYIPGARSITRHIPTNPPDPDIRAVGIPLQQSFLAGAASILLGEFAVIITQAWQCWWYPLVAPLIVIPIAGFGIFAYHNGMLMLTDKIEWGDDDGNKQDEPRSKGLPVNINITGERITPSGKKATVEHRQMFNPKTDDLGLAKWLSAILAGQAAFSERGGKKQNGAKFFRFTREEFEENRKIATDAGLVRKKGNKSIPTGKGKAVFRGIVRRDLGELPPIPQGDALGTG